MIGKPVPPRKTTNVEKSYIDSVDEILEFMRVNNLTDPKKVHLEISEEYETSFITIYASVPIPEQKYNRLMFEYEIRLNEWRKQRKAQLERELQEMEDIKIYDEQHKRD